MSRSQRLLELLQVLHHRRYPIAGKTLAAQLGISLRTLYRDIETLQAQGATITAQKGKGYQLQAGLVLPPLMFAPEEVEALVLGCRWVIEQADSALAESAKQAISKIACVLPKNLHYSLNTPLLIGYPNLTEPFNEQLIITRQAIHQQCKLTIRYLDLKEQFSERTIWPFAIGFFHHSLVVCAWCELREGFRHFRLDRIQTLTATEQPYPRQQKDLLEAWHNHHKIPKQDLFQ